MTARQKGNDAFKQGKFEQAIKLYQQYVSEDHPDNKLAYTNMAMAYFKIKQYQKVIQACESALQEDRQYIKAYYRLYLTYMELPNREYDVFINAIKFCKLAGPENAKQKEEANKVIVKYKKLFVQKGNQNLNKMDEKTYLYFKNYLQQQNQAQINEIQSKQSQIDIKSIIKAIQQTFVQQPQAGINLAYYYLNNTQKQHEKHQILNKIKELKINLKQILQQKMSQMVNQKKQSESQENQESQENLFQSSSDQKQPLKITNQHQILDKKTQTNTIINKSQMNSQKMSVQHQISEVQKSQTIKVVQKMIAEPLTTKQRQKQQQKPHQNKFYQPRYIYPESQLYQILKNLQSKNTSRDVFADTQNTIIAILEQNYQKKLKSELLSKILAKIDIKGYRRAFSKQQQKRTYELLKAHQFDQYIDYLSHRWVPLENQDIKT